LTSINEGNYAWGITKKYLCVDGYLSFSWKQKFTKIFDPPIYCFALLATRCKKDNSNSTTAIKPEQLQWINMFNIRLFNMFTIFVGSCVYDINCREQLTNHDGESRDNASDAYYWPRRHLAGSH
jgi:hypothetical protein